MWKQIKCTNITCIYCMQSFKNHMYLYVNFNKILNEELKAFSQKDSWKSAFPLGNIFTLLLQSFFSHQTGESSLKRSCELVVWGGGRAESTQSRYCPNICWQSALLCIIGSTSPISSGSVWLPRACVRTNLRSVILHAFQQGQQG